jgi:hypothetical protein
MFCNQESESP